MPKPTLSDMEAFAAVASHRSFRKAADMLGLSRSALSHTLIGLERELGVRLLHRTTRSVSPTDAGARLLERIGPMMRDFQAALDEVAEDRGGASGRLRINANRSAARFLLAAYVSCVYVHSQQRERHNASVGDGNGSHIRVGCRRA